MPSSKSASAKPVGSCTPFSLEHASQRFTFCILPSKICVRKTVASLHLQTSHNIVCNIRPPRGAKIQPELSQHLLRRLFSTAGLTIDRRTGLTRDFAEASDHPRGNRSRR